MSTDINDIVNKKDWLSGFHEGNDFGYGRGFRDGKRQITWMFWWSLANGVMFYGLLYWVWHHVKVVVS